MTDNRCPRCNQVVKGREEVSLGKPRVPAAKCPRCGTPLVLKFTNEEPAAWYYEERK